MEMASVIPAAKAHTMSTRRIVIHLIRIRLAENGFTMQLIPELAPLELESLGGDESCTFAAQLAKDFYGAAKRCEIMRYTVAAIEPARPDAYEQYVKCLSGAFTDYEIEWSRVAAAVLMTGDLAVKAVKVDCIDMAPKIVDWLTAYFNNNLVDDWLRIKGGWEKMTLGVEMSKEIHNMCKLLLVAVAQSD